MSYGEYISNYSGKPFDIGIQKLLDYDADAYAWSEKRNTPMSLSTGLKNTSGDNEIFSDIKKFKISASNQELHIAISTNVYSLVPRGDVPNLHSSVYYMIGSGNWTVKKLPDIYIQDFDYSGSVLYLRGYDTEFNSVIYETPDFINWTKTYSTTDIIYDICCSGPRPLVCCRGDDFCYITYKINGAWTNMIAVGNSGTTNVLNGVTYGNGMYVIVGLSGTILTSTDGITWTSRTSPISGTDYDLSGITYGNGMYVTVGENGTILTSTDGITWTSRTSGTTTNDLNGITYGNGMYIAVGVYGTILTSTDGITWTSGTSGTTNYLLSITYGNGMYIVVGYKGTIITSTDGITWTRRTSGTTNWLYDIAYGNGMYVIVGTNGTILTSTDGITWTSRTRGTSNFLYAITYANGMYIAVGDSGIILTSTDGITWTSRTSGSSNDLCGITYANGIYIIVGDSGTIFTSNIAREAIGGLSYSVSLNKYIGFSTYAYNDTDSIISNRHAGVYGYIIMSANGIMWTNSATVDPIGGTNGTFCITNNTKTKYMNNAIYLTGVLFNRASDSFYPAYSIIAQNGSSSVAQILEPRYANICAMSDIILNGNRTYCCMYTIDFDCPPLKNNPSILFSYDGTTWHNPYFNLLETPIGLANLSNKYAIITNTAIYYTDLIDASVDLNTLTTVQNAVVYNAINTPTTFIAQNPVNVSVVVVTGTDNSKTTMQIITVGSDAYSRKYNTSTQKFDSWGPSNNNPFIYVGDHFPYNLINGDIWICIKNKQMLGIGVYLNGHFSTLYTKDALSIDTYDFEGNAIDIETAISKSLATTGFNGFKFSDVTKYASVISKSIMNPHLNNTVTDILVWGSWLDASVTKYGIGKITPSQLVSGTAISMNELPQFNTNPLTDIFTSKNIIVFYSSSAPSKYYYSDNANISALTEVCLDSPIQYIGKTSLGGIAIATTDAIYILTERGNIKDAIKHTYKCKTNYTYLFIDYRNYIIDDDTAFFTFERDKVNNKYLSTYNDSQGTESVELTISESIDVCVPIDSQFLTLALFTKSGSEYKLDGLIDLDGGCEYIPIESATNKYMCKGAHGLSGLYNLINVSGKSRLEYMIPYLWKNVDEVMPTISLCDNSGAEILASDCLLYQNKLFYISNSIYSIGLNTPSTDLSMHINNKYTLFHLTQTLKNLFNNKLSPLWLTNSLSDFTTSANGYANVRIASALHGEESFDNIIADETELDDHIIASADDMYWSSTLSDIGRHYRISAVNGKLVSFVQTDTDTESIMFISSDGHSWKTHNTRVHSKLFGCVYGNNNYYAVGENGTIVVSSDLVGWNRRNSGSINTLRDIIYANSMYVVVGDKGTILTSTDGSAWTSRTSGVTGTLFDIAYANGMYVTVGTDRAILTSTDGITWTNRNIITDGDNIYLNAVAYGNGMYVTVGDSGTILTSTDGITWTSRTSGTTNELRDIVYGNGIYVVVEGYDHILTSTDGITWTRKSGNTDGDFFKIIYDKNMYILVGEHSAIYSSSDATTWVAEYTPINSQSNITSVLVSPNITIALTTANNIYTSTDLIRWSCNNMNNTLYGITYGNGMYIVVGDRGTILTSTDGITWTSRTSNTTNWLFGITYGNGIYVAVGYIGTIITSTDGITWTKRTSGTTNNLNGIAYGNGMYITVGDSGTILTSTDGITWTKRTSGTSSTLYGITYGNGMYITVGADGTILTSTDGITWTSRTNPISDTSKTLSAITYGNGMYVTVGADGTILTSTDGITWTSGTSGFSNYLFDIAYGNGIFCAGGEQGVICIFDSAQIAPPISSRHLIESESASLRSTWNNTALSSHKHLSDGRVKIDAANVNGGVVDTARLPAGIIKKVITVESEAAKNALTYTSINKSDIVHVYDTTQNPLYEAWYRVTSIDETTHAITYMDFTPNPSMNVAFDIIEGTPTTISGYGITDKYIKSEMDSANTLNLNTNKGYSDKRIGDIKHLFNITTHSLNITNEIYDIAYGDYKYVAVGEGGIIGISYDLHSWQTIKTDFASNLTSIIFSRELFICGTSTGSILISPNGYDWNVGYQSSNYSIVDLVDDNNGIIIATTSTQNTVIVSTDHGITWTVKTISRIGIIKDIKYNSASRMFVCCGALSTNGVVVEYDAPSNASQTLVTLASASYEALTIVNNVITAYASTGAVSTNKTSTWVTDSTITSPIIKGVAYVNSVYMAITNDYKILNSTDGTTWIDVSGTIPYNLYRIIAANNIAFVPSADGNIISIYRGDILYTIDNIQKLLSIDNTLSEIYKLFLTRTEKITYFN